MSDSVKIKPCPYCSAIYLSVNKRNPGLPPYKDGYSVNCPHCGMSGPIIKDYTEAIEAWGILSEMKDKDK